jgi:serine/threonine-protein kinase
VTDSEKTHFAVGTGPGESSAGIPRVGDVISGKYRVERVVGMGGMGVVLAVTHLQILEPYAIKFLLPKAARDPETAARFLREARAAVRIKSEHIARVSDVGQTEEGTPFIVMELLEGSDLGELVAERGRLPIADAVEYVLQACEGIAEAHALGIIHRDLKPTNLFLTTRSDGMPFVKVLDFGISKAPAEGLQHPTLTDTSSVFGSPAYMSPEQIRSAKNVDARSDVWSLGVILHELLTGEVPFEGETAGAVLSAIAADPPTRLRARRQDASEELEALVLRCLSKSAAERFANVGELAAALEPFKGSSGIASVARIQRLSVPVPGSSTPWSANRADLKAPRSAPAAPVSGSAALAVTEAPVTARGEARSGGSRWPLLVAAGGTLLLLVGAGALALRPATSASTLPPDGAAATPTSVSSTTATASATAPTPSASLAASAASASAAATRPALSAERGAPKVPGGSAAPRPSLGKPSMSDRASAPPPSTSPPSLSTSLTPPGPSSTQAAPAKTSEASPTRF